MDVDQETALEPDQMDVVNIFRSIFSSCDIENTDSVRVSDLIAFIRPYLIEDLNALEDLRHSLDPEGTDISVNSERFYEVINQWSQKLASTSSSEKIELDKSPRELNDDALPYVHSTPRASLGDKLLKCKDLLNLSNVSGYSLSTSRMDHPESERTILEEEVKKLQHQLQKTSDELFLTKQQLTIVEEQNENLQQDLVRINRRLHEEQQINKHLQKDLVYSEDLRDELGNYKKCLEELKKKLSQSEKYSSYQSESINELNAEKSKFEKKTETLSKRLQDSLKELSDLRIELQTKDAQMIQASKDFNELKREFSEQKDFIDQLREENELLTHQKLTLEKTLKTKFSRPSRSSLENDDQRQDSDEDPNKLDTMAFDRTTESLRTEMKRANYTEDNFSTVLFERDEFIAELEYKIDKQEACLKKLEDDLNESVTKERLAQSEIETLKQRLAQLEQYYWSEDGEIIETETEKLQRRVKLSEVLKGMENELHKKTEHVTFLEKEIVELREKLVNDAKLENLETEEIMNEKNTEMHLTDQSNAEQNRIEDNSLLEKLARLERKNKELEEEATRYMEDKSKLQIELVEFKENLEKRLVSEFEDKVKYSIEAEESILNLTQKCNKQQEELSNLSKTVIIKNKSLINAENQLVSLTNQNAQLQKEIDALNESKIELELKVVKIRTEHSHSLSKISNIDMMATEIQTYLHEKNDIIRELKQLNRKLEFNLNEAQLNLKKQIEDTMELRNELIKGLDVKNELWKKVCSLEAARQAQIHEINRITENWHSLIESNKELNIDYNNLLVVYDVETDKNSKLVQQVDKCKAENDELKLKLEATNREITEQKSQASQTAHNVSEIEKAFSEAEKESNQLLNELVIKLNAEVEQNKCLTNELIELRNNYTENNNELSEIKQKLAVNEDMMHKKLEQNCQKFNNLVEEMNRVKKCGLDKDNKISQIEEELKQNKSTLEKAEKTNLLLNRELEESEKKCEFLMDKLNQAKEELHQRELKINEIQTKLKDQEQFDELTKAKHQLEIKQTELENLKHQNQLVAEALDVIQQDNNQHITRLQQELMEKNEHIKNIQVSNIQLQKEKDEFIQKTNIMKQEKETLNRELVNLKKSFSNTEKNKTNRLQEEISKNRALFENFSAQKKERDQLSFDLKEAQALLSNSQALYNKKHNELQELQTKYFSMEIQVNSQTTKLLNLQTQFEKAQRDIETITSQRDALLAELDKIKTSLTEKERSIRGESSPHDREATTGRTYFRQQITIQKLKDKIEDLEDRLKSKKSKCALCSTPHKKLELEQQIIEKEVAYTALQRRYADVSCEVANMEESLKIVKQELEDVKKVRNVVEIGVQVQECEDSGGTSEEKPLNKFTLSSRSQSPDSPSPDLELINLANLTDYACSSKFVYNSHGDSILEVPPLDVQGFADDIISDLDLNDSSPRKKFEREELEDTVTALILRLVANASNVSSRIEKQTEEYRRQYEAILVLLNDISYRLRDHICIGTAEPIKPVYPLLEDIKQQLRGLVQNAGQVGVLICEERMKRCWNLVVNYVALLRQDNEALHNTSRESTLTQTQLGQKTKSTQEEESDLTAVNPQSKGRSGRRSKLAIFLSFVIILTLALCLAIDINCRMTATENQYCPLDSIVQRINVGLPPM